VLRSRQPADKAQAKLKPALDALERASLEVAEALAQAHKLEMRVLAHATSQRTYGLALDCKVDALVHGSLERLEPAIVDLLDDQLASAVAELARRLGYRRPALQFKPGRVTARNARRILRLYNSVM